jgi:predicted DNA-binding protein YlxM (UPF0122 family)
MPSLISNRAKKIPTDEIAKPLPLQPCDRNSKKLYTHCEMLELIAFLVAMDEKTLSILSEKIQNPTISLADIGRKKNITRQAIHKLVKKRCEQIPELASVFNRKNEKNPTFMEAVCQIKQKSSENNSKEPAISSNSCRSLINLSQSLDLSRLSICKELNN